MIKSTIAGIYEASREDAPGILALAKAYGDELGSISRYRSWLIQQIDRGEVFIAKTAGGKLVGFVSFHHNRLVEDEHTTVYYLCTDSDYRRKGIGRLLMEAVANDARLCGKTLITLKCPSHLPANHFYESIGYELRGKEMDSDVGSLNIWTIRL